MPVQKMTMSSKPWLAHYDAGVPTSLAPYPTGTLLDKLSDATRQRPIMKIRTLSALILLVICASLSACGSSLVELNATATQIAANISATQTAQAPTPTYTPSSTPTTQPTPELIPSPTRATQPSLTATPERRLKDFPLETSSTCQAGDLNVYSPPDYTTDTGKVDGRRFYQDAEALTDTYVEINATVVEAQFLANSNVGIGDTFVLVLIPSDSGTVKYYAAVVILPEDNGMGVAQYLPHSEIKASGVYLGLFAPPEDFFTWFPNQKGYQLPTMTAFISSGGCALP